MPPKTKVKFNESQSAKLNKDATVAPTLTGPENIPLQATPTTASRKKSRKSKILEFPSSDYNEDGNSEDRLSVTSFKSSKNSPVTFDLILSDLDKNVSDGSISDEEVPQVKWPSPDTGKGKDTSVCPSAMAGECAAENDGITTATPASCSTASKLTVSQKVTPCMKYDDEKFSTTEFTSSAAMSFLPNLIHPINGQVSTFTRHREYTNYLRDSGCLKLFGISILSVYRMKNWPPPENLIEKILNSMEYHIPIRKQVDELTILKKSLIDQLKTLIEERCLLLEKLDEHQDFAATYELMDQDEILPPRPENSPIDMGLLTYTFQNMKDANSSTGLASTSSGDQDKSTDIKVLMPKEPPISDTLPIPEHDKRMLL